MDTLVTGATDNNDEGITLEAFDFGGVLSTGNQGTSKSVTTAGQGSVISGDIRFTTSEPTDTAFSVASSSVANFAIMDQSGSTGTDETGTITASTDKVSTMSVTSVANANIAIQVIDAAIASISSTRADLGATQNRFDSIVSGLQVASDNQSAARSRIVDADFATETAKLTRGQILQQAGIAVLAQANAAPQNVLSLLQ